MKPKRGQFSRTRGIEDFDRKFGKNILLGAIKKARIKNKKLRILEFGCGEGRVLLQIQKKFPDAELHGINKSKWPAMKGQQSLKRTAILNKIYTKKELFKANLPKIHFYDARKLRFKDNYLDLIYSQVSYHYVARKDQLIEEIWRVLKKGGKAIIHIDTWNAEYPDFISNETPRFIVYEDKKKVPLKKIIKKLQENGFGIKYNIKISEDGKSKRIFITMYKNNQKKIKLNLKFNKQESFPLNFIDKERKREDIFWGYRSVFSMK